LSRHSRPNRHPYELFLQLEGIEHRKTRVKRPQSNGIVERFHRTLLDEHFRVEGRRTWFETVEEMQAALDAYLVSYNTDRSHQGRGMNGRTPYRAFLDRIPANDNSQEDTDRQTDQAHAA
jgi:transposase InsO family protein